jgi:hypothetical protein
MKSGPPVSQADATSLTVVKGAAGEKAAGEKLAQTRARCQAALAAAEESVQRAQAALFAAQVRLRRAKDVEMRFRERRTSKIPVA